MNCNEVRYADHVSSIVFVLQGLVDEICGDELERNEASERNDLNHDVLELIKHHEGRHRDGQHQTEQAKRKSYFQEHAIDIVLPRVEAGQTSQYKDALE